ncbi:MAG TPA: PhoPQ-activated protein PqaA family protein, partial [Kiritimatiellia bacterium]|nr:PhoPQ-activated protein PqaA family protein [Kiritimatiellia bacterium]HPW76278.1 PhoPQ-activated protein PqaA family protein [Kiritimatiellia bacterium]
ELRIFRGICLTVGMAAYGLALGGEPAGKTREAVFAASDLRQSPLNEETLSETTSNGVVTTDFFFSGGEFNGQPSRIRAFYSRPEKKGVYPGVVQLHGAGLDVLNSKASICYASNGFACISIDWCGPERKRKKPRNPPYSEFNEAGKQATVEVFPDEIGANGKKPRYDYHAVPVEADGIGAGVRFVRRSVMFLKSRPEVQHDQLFLSGMSAGAHLSLLVLGVEPSFKGAAVKYGCAYIRDFPGYFGGYFGPLYLCPKPEQDAWLRVFEPRHGLPDYAASVLLLSGTDDIFFMMPLVLETYRNIPSEKRLLMLPNDNHSQVGNEILPARYFRSLLGKAPAFPDAEAPTAEVVGQEIRLRCAVKVPSPLLKSVFYVKRMPVANFEFRKSKDVKWEAVPTTLQKKVCSAMIPAPAEGEQVIAYLLLEDETGARISSDTVEIPAYPKWRGVTQ